MELAANPSRPENPENKVSESGEKKPDKWEIDNWVRTVIEAEEIRDDPEKMKHVAPLLEKKAASAQKAIRSIADLRSAADKMNTKKPKKEDKNAV